MSSQRQVAGFVGAAVLFGDDVLDVMGQFAVCLREQAVFTPILRPAPDEVARGGTASRRSASGDAAL